MNNYSQTKFNSIINLSEFPFVIKWRLTNLCNYKCSYCIRKKQTNSLETTDFKDNKERIYKALPDIIRLINDKNCSTKLELIGGEVSLFDLTDIISRINSKTNSNLKRISITSNFYRPIKYYNDLINYCITNNLELSLTFSFHPEFINLKSFISKFNSLVKHNLIILRAEMVSTLDNKELVMNFINECKQFNITYFVDADLTEKNNDNLIIETSENKKDCFKVIFDDHYELFKSKRALLKTYGINYKILNTSGLYCTLDYDYIYIDIDTHVGFSPFNNYCKNKTSIKDFHVNTKPRICPRGCSLCGELSVFNDFKYYRKDEN